MSLTMKEVADQIGVSQTTVSMVLNNTYKSRVSEEKRKRVIKKVEELGYRPHSMARGLVLNKTYSIGIALRSTDLLSDPYFSTIIGGVAHQVGVHDYNMHFTITDRDAKYPFKNLLFAKKVKERCLDGLIIADQRVSDEEILWLKDVEVPFVIMDRFISGQSVNCVRTDNRQGIFDAVEHLLKLGHKRIAFFSEPMQWNKIADMLAGYKIALEEHGQSFDERLVGAGDFEFDKEEVPPAIDRLFDLSTPPTAIICSSDKIAVAVLGVLKKKGIKVPENAALVGYNDDPNFSYLEPPLTTVRVPLRQLGEEAGGMLFKLINGEEVDEPELVLEPMLVVRESCGASVGKV